MITLRQITDDDCLKIVSWNQSKNEEYLYQWAGSKTYKYPITSEQIKARFTEENTIIFVIFSDDEAVGSVELNKINRGESSANVCRFILSDDFQNIGIGTSALKQLVNIAFNEMNLKKLTLSVFCYNVAALRCYEKCGFRVKTFYQRDDSKWNSYSMELLKSEK